MAERLRQIATSGARITSASRIQKTASRKLGGMAQDIVDQCQIILSRCKDIVNFITMARATITEALHKKHLIAIMKAVTYIIKGVEDDEKKFSPRTIQQTLDQIRRAA